MKNEYKAPRRKSGDAALAKYCLARGKRMIADREPMDGLMQECAEMIQPRKANVTRKESITPETSDLFNTTAIDANITLAAGQLNYMTPSTERWMAYEQPEEIRIKQGNTGAVARFYEQTTEIAMRELSRSKFYLIIHEVYLDRGCFGTAPMFCDWSEKKGMLNFKTFENGSYAIDVDEEGDVNALVRVFKLSLRNIVAQFKVENLGKGLRESWDNAQKDGNGKALDEKHEIWHLIYERTDDERVPGKLDQMNMPIASVYIALKDEWVLSNGGFDEWPAPVTRFLHWGESPWGWSPGMVALPTIRQTNFLEMMMDALAEKAAFPSVLVPSSMEGELDMTSGGVSVFNEQLQGDQMPREWGTQGRYDIGKDRIEVKKQMIEDAYHVGLFKMIAERDKNMTAREVIELVQEKLTQFSPTFARMTVEFFNPLLQRVFNLLYRQGKFPEAPEGAFVQGKDGEFRLALPKIAYTSKIAMALKALENQAFFNFIEAIVPLITADPSIAQEFKRIINLEKALKGVAKNFSLPIDYTRTDEEIAAIKQAEEQAQAQAAQAEQAQQLAGAAATASKASPAMQRTLAAGATGGA